MKKLSQYFLKSWFNRRIGLIMLLVLLLHGVALQPFISRPVAVKETMAQVPMQLLPALPIQHMTRPQQKDRPSKSPRAKPPRLQAPLQPSAPSSLSSSLARPLPPSPPLPQSPPQLATSVSAPGLSLPQETNIIPDPGVSAQPLSNLPLAPAGTEADEAGTVVKAEASTQPISTLNAESMDKANGAGTHQPETAEQFSLPPSSITTYTVYINGIPNRDSSIRWINNGAHYQLQVDIPLPFVGTFSYRSAGGVDGYGLAPLRYEEVRGKRAAVSTNFNRDERQNISFSRVTTMLPLVPGAQDRFSVLWQLVALSRGNPERNTLGATRVFYVADTDQAEEWKIQVLEEEDLELPTGWVRARHFLRLPRYDDDRRKLEVWLAESEGWIPVKIRQTEPSGQVLELLLKNKRPIESQTP